MLNEEEKELVMGTVSGFLDDLKLFENDAVQTIYYTLHVTNGIYTRKEDLLSLETILTITDLFFEGEKQERLEIEREKLKIKYKMMGIDEKEIKEQIVEIVKNNYKGK